MENNSMLFGFELYQNSVLFPTIRLSVVENVAFAVNGQAD